MAFFVEIHDKTNDFLMFDLKELLQVIGVNGSQLDWAIYELENIGSPRLTNPLELEEKANNNEFGLPMSWQELNDFAGNVEQVVWGLFIAVRRGKPFPARQSVSRLALHSEITLYAFDSDHWQVFAREDSLLDKLKVRFHDIRPRTASD